jgi:hypothetical protein
VLVATALDKSHRGTSAACLMLCIAAPSHLHPLQHLQQSSARCRSFELQGVITCMACRLCYVHTENDEPPVATAAATSASISLNAPSSNLSPNPLNPCQLAAMGGVAAVMSCLHRSVTRCAGDAALAVLLDAACLRDVSRTGVLALPHLFH